MPDMDGVSLARATQCLPTYVEEVLPIIILTSSVDMPRKDPAITSSIHKPAREQHLYRELQSIIFKAQKHTSGKPEGTLHTATKPSKKKKARVLIADDNAVNQRVAAIMLQSLGFEDVVIVADGDEAIKAVEESKYDVILMDVAMPRVSGLEATKAIRKITANDSEPLILGLSAAAMEEDRRNGIDSGMNGYITKPLKIEELGAVLENLI